MEFYNQKISAIVHKIQKYYEHIEERKISIQAHTVLLNELYKQENKTMAEIFEEEQKIQRKIGQMHAQIDFLEGEIETLRERQYYLIQWKNKCYRYELDALCI